MDDRLQKALDFSNYRISLFNQKESIKLKVDTLLTYACNGGVFKASAELVSFIKILIDLNHQSVVLLDINQNPIEITDLAKFQTDILSKYFEATNYYHSEYTKLRKTRSVKDQFVDIIEEN